MAQKLFVNQTNYEIQGILAVRAGDNPGQELNSVQFTLPAQGQQMVSYGDSADPYADELTISAVTNGAESLSDQRVLLRGSQLDNLLNQNDTVYIQLTGQNLTITSGNTWTT